MALRAYLGGISTQRGLLGCIASSSSPPCFHRATRRYAATNASLKKKTPATAKGTRKAASRTPKKTSEMETTDLNPYNITEDQTKELDRMLVMAQYMPTLDPWGLEVPDTLGASLYDFIF